MNRIRLVISFFLLALVSLVTGAASLPPGQNWTHYVRIAAFPLQSSNPDEIVRQAQDDHVFGIEVDNDIAGRYESFLDPTAKLAAIRAVAERAHQAGNRAFVYIAGTECITADADKTPHSMAKEHPDWLQRKIDGTPAVFGGGTAFWIKAGDEDVWISPFATEWRKVYMERVRQIAATGIDGIYVDIPYWMTHFDGWENTWASFDDFTVNAFRKETGLDAKKDVKLGDFSDPNFRKWIDFRIRALTDFMREINQNAKSVNPQIMTIPEIYPGIEEEAVRVGADVYQMYGVVDAIAHEYEFGGGDHMASSRSQLDWFRYMVGWSSFRAFAGGKATWMLNYSWDGDKNIDASEAMQNLFMAELVAGVNVWDAQGHVMSGSNDAATRRKVFAWIAAHERTFYAPREPMRPVGVYFSPATRNYYTTEFLNSYQGIIILLLQEHYEYQIVTPRSLQEFHGNTLVMPNVRVLDEDEKRWLRSYVANGGRLVITGEDSTSLPKTSNVVRFPICPGRTYLSKAEKDFTAAHLTTETTFLATIRKSPELQLEAPPFVATQIASVDGKPHIFFANFSGLVPGKNAVQHPATNLRVRIPAGRGRRLFLLPFLGESQEIPGRRVGKQIVFRIPRVDKGAVAWLEPSQ
ncbi:MAG: hypothetical protein LAO22_23365 [Acidobacteriia bacterium]|nr:hypothetical protein [Terriglobia bacterium]